MSEEIVHPALEHFNIPDASIELIKSSNNAVYRVETASKTYALRIHQPGRRKLEWIKSELTWLNAIHRDTNLHVPRPAAPIYIANSSDNPTYCTLLEWIAGNQVLPNATTPELAQKIGAFIAHLHNHSASFTAPDNFSLPHLDWDGMFGITSPYQVGKSDDLFTDQQLHVLNEIGRRVQNTMATLDQQPTQFGVIHADLIWKNILFNGDNIGAIDFDDCAYGYYLYDLAPTLLGYLDEPNYSEIRAAIWDGYTSTRPLPNSFDNHLDTLVAGRHALSCRWIAINRHNPAIEGRAADIIAYRIQQLEHYLETGKLRRGEIIV